MQSVHPIYTIEIQLSAMTPCDKIKIKHTLNRLIEKLRNVRPKQIFLDKQHRQELFKTSHIIINATHNIIP